MTPDELAPSFKGKSAKDQIQIIKRILESGQRGVLPLSQEESKTLTDFMLASNRGNVDEGLWQETNKLVRQYEQLLIARTTG